MNRARAIALLATILIVGAVVAASNRPPLPAILIYGGLVRIVRYFGA